MNSTVEQKTPKLHAIENVRVVRARVKAEFTVKSVDFFKKVQISYDDFVSLFTKAQISLKRLENKLKVI